MAGQVELTRNEEATFATLLRDSSLLSVFAISFIGALGSNAVPAALPAISSALNVGSGQIGLVLAVFYLPLIVLNPVLGIFSDMYGRRRIIIPSLVAFAASGVATLAVDQFEVLLALRIVQAVAFAGTLPLTATLVGDLYGGVAGSTAQGLRSSVNGIASTVGPVLAGLLAVVNWRYPFLLFTFAIPIAGVFYMYYPEVTTPTDDGDDNALSELRTELHTYWQVIRTEAADRTLGVTLIGGFTLFFVKQGMKAYVPVFIVQSLGGTTSTAGLVLGIYGGVRMFVAPLAGPVSERTGRKYGLIGSLLLLGFAMAAIPVTSAVASLSAVIIIFAIGESIFNPVLKSTLADLASDDNRGGIIGAHSMLAAAANTISPAIVGFVLVVAGFKAAFLLPAIVGILFAGCIYLFVDQSRLDTTSTEP